MSSGRATANPNRRPARAYDFENDRVTITRSHCFTSSRQLESAKSP